jgi:O-antigen/teichoic acid export membrane protein
VEVSAASTAVRLISNIVYRRKAYRVFPLLSVRPSLFRRARLREVSGYSIYSAVAGWAFRLNYMTDSLIIGAFMGPAAVALWAVPRRLSQAVRSLTNQFNNVLLPVVVDSQARGTVARLRAILLHGTRISLLGAMPLAAAMFLLADPLIPLYVGNDFAASVAVAQVMAVLVAFRVGNATAMVVLKGMKGYKLYAFTQLGVAIVNVALSLWWIQVYGLVGQAMGTLVPVAIGSMFVLWPAACRYVEVTAWTAFRQAVWPALWPVPAAVIPIVLLKPYLPRQLLAVLLAGALGWLCYMIVALGLALGAQERRMYMKKLKQIGRFWRVSSETAEGPTATPPTPANPPAMIPQRANTATEAT